MSTFRFAIGVMLNQQLREVFRLINYPNPFKVRIAEHLEARYLERVDEANKQKFADLLTRITTVGLCEVLYYHARFKLGHDLGGMEFHNSDVIVPFNFTDDTIALNTVFIRRPDQDRSMYNVIDLGNGRLAQR